MMRSRQTKYTIIAVDLGAESCRVSLLRWQGEQPEVTLVHRFANGPVECDSELRWDLDAIWNGIVTGLKRSAELAPEGIESIAVDGWAVDYVRLNADGHPAAQPFCYRDLRTVAAEAKALEKISQKRLYQLAGVQNLRFNTVYQLYADELAGVYAGLPWLNLPEYVLYKLGGRRVSEYTNATHTGLVDVHTRQWCGEIFSVLGLDLAAAPDLVAPGSDVGMLAGPLADLEALRNTRLIAPACHDTASAIAGIPANGSNWAYISSGTWSLVGMVLEHACTVDGAFEHKFTNLGAAGGKVCFHTNVNGMWLIKQCMQHWCDQDNSLNLDAIIAAAEKLPPPDALLEVDDAELLLPGNMPQRINSQRERFGFAKLPESPASAPLFANLIFHSLAARYAEVLSHLSAITGHAVGQLFIVGGGSANRYLNRLTEATTGLQVSVGHRESSTIGNLAIQLATLNSGRAAGHAEAEEVNAWARILSDAAWSSAQ